MRRCIPELLSRGAVPVTRDRGAGDVIRTVPPQEFESMLEALSSGAQVVPSPSTYRGVWYRRLDGSVFGIRRSDEHGITFDVIRSNHPAIRNGDKVHQNE